MSYVLNEHQGEDAWGSTIIETNGVAHHITFAVDHIRQEPKIAYETKRVGSQSRCRHTNTGRTK
jgi:hypothetical protein